jgi:hypothetical protein
MVEEDSGGREGRRAQSSREGAVRGEGAEADPRKKVGRKFSLSSILFSSRDYY